MLTPSIHVSYAGPGYGRGLSIYCDKPGGAIWGIGTGTGCTVSPLVVALLLVLRIPFLSRFMCPLAVAGLGFKYLVTSSPDRLGHPFKKPFRNAFKREDILGLHIAWCPNFDCVGSCTHRVCEHGYVCIWRYMFLRLWGACYIGAGSRLDIGTTLPINSLGGPQFHLIFIYRLGCEW